MFRDSQWCTKYHEATYTSGKVVEHGGLGLKKMSGWVRVLEIQGSEWNWKFVLDSGGGGGIIYPARSASLRATAADDANPRHQSVS